MNGNGRQQRRKVEDGDRGLIWKLPQLKVKDVGKVGPAFGLGAGCGLGFALGFIGGAGFGPGIPGLQVGFGFGAGCGVGLGFGYGVGRGIAYDEYRTYSNVGRLFGHQHLPLHIISQLSMTLLFLVKQKGQLSLMLQKDEVIWTQSSNGMGSSQSLALGIFLDINRSSTHSYPRDEIGGLIDELVINTKKVAIAASREIDKWRR